MTGLRRKLVHWLMPEIQRQMQINLRINASRVLKRSRDA